MKEKYAKKFECLNAPFGLQMLAIKKINSIVGESLINDEYYFYKENYVTVYVFPHEIAKVREYGFKKFKEDQTYFKNLYSETIALFDDFKTKEKSLIDEIDKLKNEQEIKTWLKTFCKYASDVTPMGYFAEIFAGYDNYWLDSLKINKEDFAALTSPDDVSFSKQFELAIAKIKLGKSTKNITDIVNEWYWVRNNYFIVDVVDEKLVKDQLEKMTADEAKHIGEEAKIMVENIKKNKVGVINKLNLRKQEKLILDGLASFVVLQDKRKEIALKTTSFLIRACTKLVNLYEYNDEEKNVVLSSALHNWFYEYDKEELLSKSKDAFTGLIFPIGGDIIIGSPAQEKENQLTDNLESGEVKEIKGQVAFRGKIKGKVKVVIKNTDFSKFEEGDILVTSMTRPEFVSLMQKASAFVTDEGGITCHAAIVAREMKKPCIIGTKIATQVLKDGMEIEIDADNGVIKIIEKTK